MSLRVRLNLLITLLFISLFVCSSFYIIANARSTVHQEVQSTANLALQLIQAAIAMTPAEENKGAQLHFLQSLSKLDETRHLNIEIRNPHDVLIAGNNFNILENTVAPDWFVNLVEPPPTELKRWLYNPLIPPTGIIVRADPSDEIDENWQEVKSILILLLVFIVLANMLVYILVGYYLSPIDTILRGLSDIEKGQYKLELPRFRLPELDRISQRFNHMAKVLLKSRAENQLLTQRSLEIQEEERRHLSQELHDELGQTIAAIKAVAVAISNDRQSEPEQIDSNVKTIIQYSDHIYKVAKNMMHRLRPSILDEFGLIKALQNMIDDWNSRQDDIFCHFSFSNIPDDLSEPVKISLFRIIQESLTNVLKHSSANEVYISMKTIRKKDTEIIHLLIKDDGVGLDVDNINPGLGLLGIRERVELLGGNIELSGSKNNGLTLEINIPLESERK